jgi:hypothetical protein
MIPKLFVAALVSVLTAIGVALSALGWVAVVAYAVVVAVAVGLAARAQRTKRADDGRTCSCCTSTVVDPVQVVGSVDGVDVS